MTRGIWTGLGTLLVLGLLVFGAPHRALADPGLTISSNPTIDQISTATGTGFPPGVNGIFCAALNLAKDRCLVPQIPVTTDANGGVIVNFPTPNLPGSNIAYLSIGNQSVGNVNLEAPYVANPAPVVNIPTPLERAEERAEYVLLQSGQATPPGYRSALSGHGVGSGEIGIAFHPDYRFPPLGHQVVPQGYANIPVLNGGYLTGNNWALINAVNVACMQNRTDWWAVGNGPIIFADGFESGNLAAWAGGSGVRGIHSFQQNQRNNWLGWCR